MIDAFGGLAAQVPLFTAIFGIVTFSSIGLPGLNGFVGEFLILLGSYKARMWVFGALAATGVILGAVYMLSMFQRVMYGTLDKEENRNLPDLNLRELFTLVPIVLLIFWVGVYPKPFLKVIEPPVRKVVVKLENARVNIGLQPMAQAPEGLKVAMDKHSISPKGE